MSAKEAAKKTDLEALERDYRANILSNRELGAKHGCSEGMVRKHAKAAEKAGRPWLRDLEAKIQQKADDLVRKGVDSKASSEREVVEANAMAITNIRLSHRSNIGKGNSLVMELIEELQGMTGNKELLEQLGTIMRREDDKGQDKLNDIYLAVISLPERAKTMKHLVDSLKSLIGLEREAWNIVAGADKKPDEVETLTDEELDERIQDKIDRLKPSRAG